jgi:hypothetical protein
MTPAAIISGETHVRSNDRTWAVRVVPTLAPSMTASAIDSVISPRPAKEASRSAVAVLDCSTPVRARPPPNAVKRLREQAPIARRSAAPKARVRPVRTMRTPHSSRATLPMTFRMVVTPCITVES